MTTVADPGTVLRPHAEHEHQAELAALAAADDRPRPPGWRLSPWAVTTYLLGGTAADGTEITPKYVGSRRLVEVAVATLATDRALLLIATSAPRGSNTKCAQRLRQLLWVHSPVRVGKLSPNIGFPLFEFASVASS